MTLKEIAEKLDGTMEYPSMPKDIVKAAIESGIVIVHGCSDDLIEFEGAIRDEAGCFDGGKIYFNKSGFLEEGSAAGRLIKVFWDGQCEDEKRPFEATWEYETDIPHETFRMLDEEELYCKGIVFYLKDIDQKPDLTKENIEVLISVAYSKGWDDGRTGKDLPKPETLQKMAAAIYERATEKPIDNLKETGDGDTYNI